MAGEDELFGFLDDLEQQAGAAFDAERAPEVADRTRAEYREVTLSARLMASVGREVTLHVEGVGALLGRLDRVSLEWCALEAGAGRWAVRLLAITAVEGASERAVPELAWPATARLGLGSQLRGLAEAGAPCVLHLRDGRRREGRLRRVGQDFVELVEGDPGRDVLVALDAVSAVQSAAPML